MIHGVQLTVLFNDDQARTTLNDIGRFFNFTLNNETLARHNMPEGHFFKKRASILLVNKLQELGVPVCDPFFFLNHFIEVAIQTGPPFVGKGPLSTPATKCTRNRPADSAAALSGVNSVIGGIGSRTAYSKFRYFASLWLSAAFHMFPAILSFFCHISDLVIYFEKIAVNLCSLWNCMKTDMGLIQEFRNSGI
jgi:hypothetical protein